MIREQVLKTKHDEISTRSTSRKRKLRELYFITIATVSDAANSEPANFNHGLATFLDVNDITKGRSFNRSSLPSIAPLKKALYDTAVGATSSLLGTSHPSREHARGDSTAPTTSPTKVVTPISQTANATARLHQNTAVSRVSPQPSASSPQSQVPETFDAISNSVSEDTESSDAAAKDLGPQTPDSSHAQNVSKPAVSLSSESKTQDTQKASDIVARHSPESRVEGYHVQQPPGFPEKLSIGASTQFNNDALRTSQNAHEEAVTKLQEETNGAKDDGSPSILVREKTEDEQRDNAQFGDTLSVPTSLQTAPSTPEDQLRREEAQSLKSNGVREQVSAILSPIPESTLPEGTDTSAVEVTSTGLSHLHSGTQPAESAVTTPPIVANDKSSNTIEPLGDLPNSVVKDATSSQRRPMRIDTTIAAPRHKDFSSDKAYADSALTSETPGRPSTASRPNTAVTHPSPPERMTTRVSSGALRHKSVSEILGETPRPSPSSEKYGTERFQDSRRTELPPNTPSHSSLILSPESTSFRSRQNDIKERERERSKLSTVIFSKKSPNDTLRKTGSALVLRQGQSAASVEEKDYLLSLFRAQAGSGRGAQTLGTLLNSAHKTLTTANHYVALQERVDYRILRKIYDRQYTNHWALRQIERSAEPARPVSHWDILLSHAKWLRTDFREERKWKLTVAKNLADWCTEWVISPVDEREGLQTSGSRQGSRRRMSRENGYSKQRQISDGFCRNDNHNPQSTPDLIPSLVDDSSDLPDAETPVLDVSFANAPASMFSLAPEDVLFNLDKTHSSEQLLSELHLYQPGFELLETAVHPIYRTYDRAWLLPAAPVSKYVQGKLVFQEEGPPRKKSRYDYGNSDDEEDYLVAENATPLKPEQSNVALFNTENKHIRDRIHAGHAFRPPSEYSMPTQSFFESRHSSQWTYSEDDELRRLVREYSYNWSLISSCLSSQSIFSSGAERRTPWECFERWVGLEGLPTDMAKTQYFRAYHARLDAAQRTLMSQQPIPPQVPGSNSQILLRRRSAQPIRVERRRNNKHLAMVHAMQKLAKRRETTVQKQQHVASLAALRKANEITQPRQRNQTPQEWSKYKYDREIREAEEKERRRQMMIIQQRQALMAKNAQIAQQAGPASVHARNIVNAAMNGHSPNLQSALPNGHVPSNIPNQDRSSLSSQQLVNSVVVNSQQAVNHQAGVRGGHAPQAPMVARPQGQQQRMPQMTPDQMRIYLEASRVQQEQYLQLQQQQQSQRQQQQQQQHQAHHPQQTQINGHSSVAASTTPQQSSAMLANVQSTNGFPSPSTNGAQNSARMLVSPRMGESVPVNGQSLSSGVVPVVNQILNGVKTQHPNLSPEQQHKMASEQLDRYRLQSSQQAAMQAAAGHGGSNPNLHYVGAQRPVGTTTNNNNNNPIVTQQMYAQLLRSQQSSQQIRNGTNGMTNGVRPPSRDAAMQQNQIQRTLSSGQSGSS